MTTKRVLLSICGMWELVRLILLTSVFVAAINPEGDFLTSTLILLLGGGNILLPILLFAPVFFSSDESGITLRYARIAKVWMILWEGLLVLLTSSFGVVLLSVVEYVTGADAVYRIFSSGLIRLLPSGALSIIFWLDLIFLAVILLYKSDTSRNSLEAFQKSGKSLPDADVIRVEEDE